MTRQHAARSNVVRRLRLSPDRIAAAAALQDPNLLLQLKAAESHAERPITAAPTPPSRMHPGSFFVFAYAIGEPLGIVIASCALAVAALAPLRRRPGATPARRGHRPVVASLCPAR